MTIEIQTRIEGRRGCGWRKPGGIYLVGPPEGQPCCKLPCPLTICPCCGAGIKPSRGWTWIDTHKFFWPNGYDQYHDECHDRNIDDSPRLTCPLSHPDNIGQMAGLLWIGERFYKTPQDFLTEAGVQGISRRLSTIPKEFVPGKTWVLLTHRKGVAPANTPDAPGDYSRDWLPAIFAMFRPSGIEYVTRGDETKEELERVVARGMVPVEVNPRRAYR